jgi:hypothetical protein
MYFFEDHVVDSDDEAETLFAAGESDAPHEGTCDMRDDDMAGIRPLLSTPGFELAGSLPPPPHPPPSFSLLVFHLAHLPTSAC